MPKQKREDGDWKSFLFKVNLTFCSRADNVLVIIIFMKAINETLQ